MKLNLLATPLGLKPLYPEDFDEEKKLKNGTIYTADIRSPSSTRATPTSRGTCNKPISRPWSPSANRF